MNAKASPHTYILHENLYEYASAVTDEESAVSLDC